MSYYIPSKEIEECVKEYMKYFLQGMQPFSKLDMLYVAAAQNKIMLFLDEPMVERLCRRTIRENHKLIPFCQKCGSTKHLFSFCKNSIYCNRCFINTFGQKPIVHRIGRVFEIVV